MDKIQHNLASASFEEFIDFLFDHKVVPIPDTQSDAPEPWYWHSEVEYDAVAVVGYYIRLFSNPRFLLLKFSRDQLEQGFWAIHSGNLECSVDQMIWHKGVPFEDREHCVQSMFHLFEKLFAYDSFDTSVNMWWDSLAYDWHCGNRSRSNGGEDQLIQDVMFQTLGRILSLPSEACQMSALHGLGHLHHPDTQNLIERFLRENCSASAKLREYAQEAARFEVL